MKWLIKELMAVVAQFKRAETWFGIGLITGFGLLAYLVAKFAFQTDSVLRYLHLTASTCRDLSNGPIIFLFFGMIFFMLAVVVTFGEFQRYFTLRHRPAHFETRQALIYGICWALVAIGISVAALLFFNAYCR